MGLRRIRHGRGSSGSIPGSGPREIDNLAILKSIDLRSFARSFEVPLQDPFSEVPSLLFE